MHSQIKIDNHNNAKEKPKKGNLDTILTEDAGQFGAYQLRLLLLAALLVAFSAMSNLDFVFTSAAIKTRCLIPKCEKEAIDFSPSWISNAVPTSEGAIADCHRYNSSNLTARADECPKEWFDRDVVVSCSDYVYENTDTVVFHFGLACDEWRRSFVGLASSFASLVSWPMTGYISDRWGRRFALCWNVLNLTCLGIVRIWVNNYYGYLAVEFLKSALGSGCFSCAYILVMELVGPKYRVRVGASISTSFAIGQICLGLIAWANPYWKNLILTICIPQLIFISYFWIMSESVRWYMSKGRYGEAEDLLKKVARINKRELSENSLKAIRENEEAGKKSKAEHKQKEPWLITLVIQNKVILRRCCMSPIWWVTSSLVYYGLSINAVSLSGNRYINFIAAAAAEIPGYWIAIMLLDRVGRKPVLIGAYWTCAVCQLAYIFIPNNFYGASLTVYLIGKLCIAVVVTSVYLYTAEIYPTKYRHSLLAFSSMVGRIGSIVSPLTPAMSASIWHHFPSALFCGFAVIAGATVFLTPETLGTRLPDTMEEASVIGTNKPTDRSQSC